MAFASTQLHCAFEFAEQIPVKGTFFLTDMVSFVLKATWFVVKPTRKTAIFQWAQKKKRRHSHTPKAPPPKWDVSYEAMDLAAFAAAGVGFLRLELAPRLTDDPRTPGLPASHIPSFTLSPRKGGGSTWFNGSPTRYPRSRALSHPFLFLGEIRFPY